MPRKRRKAKARRAGLDSEGVCWLLNEPYQHDNVFAELMSTFPALTAAVTTGMLRGFTAMSNEYTPITPEDVKYLPRWMGEFGALKAARKVYDELPPDLQAEVPEDRKALIMAVDENLGNPELWWERKREEQREIDKRTGRKEGQLLGRGGRPYYVKDLGVEGNLRGAARARDSDLRAVFEATPMHVRIRVPEAWAILDAQSREDLWDALLEHHADLDLDRPFKLSYRSDAVEYTIRQWSSMEPSEREEAVERESKPILIA